jgi:hypothetical protein
MRRGLFVLLLLPPLTTAASAQQGLATAQLVAATTIAPATAENVVERIMSFDRNKDGRVTGDELPERMLNLLANDTNGDGALVSAEITARARVTAVPNGNTPFRLGAPAFATTVPGGRGGGYTFGDQVSLSSRSHIEGALDDLRLDTIAREQALAIVHPFMDTVEARAAATLTKELTPLLNQAQLDGFKAALDRQMTGTTRTRRAGPESPVPPPFNKSAQFFRIEPDLTFRINSFQLPPHQAAEAQAALDRFKATIRPGEAEREELLAKLEEVLSAEDRENFGAALARRPLVKASDVLAGVVGGMRELRQGVGSIQDGMVIVRPTLPPKPVER